MKWKKPSGLEVETSNKKGTVEYCKSLGWKRDGGNAPKDEPKFAKATENPSKASPR